MAMLTNAREIFNNSSIGNRHVIVCDVVIGHSYHRTNSLAQREFFGGDSFSYLKSGKKRLVSTNIIQQLLFSYFEIV